MTREDDPLKTAGRVLVLYDSASGNTAAMAQLVAEGCRAVEGVEVRLKHIDEASAEDVVWCDGVAVGSPTNMGLMSWKMKRFWDVTMLDQWMKIDGKIGCAFSSSGGWGGGTEIACQSILSVLINFGFLVFGVTDYVSKLTTLHYGTTTAREPRSDEAKDACRKLGKRLAEWVAVYCGGQKSAHPLVKDDERLFPSDDSAEA